MKVIICGDSVIGTSIAYFLNQRGVEVVVVERTGVANAASGKSGGFLAHDWCDGSLLAPQLRFAWISSEQPGARLGLPSGRNVENNCQRHERRWSLSQSTLARVAWGRRRRV